MCAEVQSFWNRLVGEIGGLDDVPVLKTQAQLVAYDLRLHREQLCRVGAIVVSDTCTCERTQRDTVLPAQSMPHHGQLQVVEAEIVRTYADGAVKAAQRPLLPDELRRLFAFEARLASILRQH